MIPLRPNDYTRLDVEEKRIIERMAIDAAVSLRALQGACIDGGPYVERLREHFEGQMADLSAELAFHGFKPSRDLAECLVVVVAEDLLNTQFRIGLYRKAINSVKEHQEAMAKALLEVKRELEKNPL